MCILELRNPALEYDYSEQLAGFGKSIDLCSLGGLGICVTILALNRHDPSFRSKK